MKEQFLQSLSSDDISMTSISSSQGPNHEEAPDQEENQFAVLARESQGPADNEPNLGDFWDSLTSLITEKINQENDKQWIGKTE